MLLEQLVNKTGIVNYHLLDGDGDTADVVRRASESLAAEPVDIAFLGIGENGHLAFNDPPADFQSEAAYIIVDLDEPCRRQQLGEGWFKNLDEVPRRALSMTVRQILNARQIIAIVPDARKANAVRACLEDPIAPEVPASILRTHADVTIYLDRDSASLLSPE